MQSRIIAEKGTGSRSRKMNWPNLNMNSRQNRYRPITTRIFLKKNKKSTRLIKKSRMAASFIHFQDFFFSFCLTGKVLVLGYIKLS